MTCPICKLDKELKHKIFLPTEDQEDDHLICDDKSLLVCDDCIGGFQ